MGHVKVAVQAGYDTFSQHDNPDKYFFHKLIECNGYFLG